MDTFRSNEYAEINDDSLDDQDGPDGPDIFSSSQATILVGDDNRPADDHKRLDLSSFKKNGHQMENR